MWLDQVFTIKELENKTRALYQRTRNDNASFSSAFEKEFNMPYKLAFGNISYEDCMNKLLKNYYRNEIVIKELLKDTLLRKEKVLFEYVSGNSRADVASIGNKLECYEIKTKYDNLNRLDKQILDYSKVFEYVYVVCSEEKKEDVKKRIPEFCGIISYKDRKNGILKIVEKAQKSPNMESRCILNQLRKQELINYFETNNKEIIIKKYSKQEIIDKYKECLAVRYVMN